jgi:TRAP-type C4-dicarboxylate transport system permease small subunit
LHTYSFLQERRKAIIAIIGGVLVILLVAGVALAAYQVFKPSSSSLAPSPTPSGPTGYWTDFKLPTFAKPMYV